MIYIFFFLLEIQWKCMRKLRSWDDKCTWINRNRLLLIKQKYPRWILFFFLATISANENIQKILYILCAYTARAQKKKNKNDHCKIPLCVAVHCTSIIIFFSPSHWFWFSVFFFFLFFCFVFFLCFSVLYFFWFYCCVYIVTKTNQKKKQEIEIAKFRECCVWVRSRTTSMRGQEKKESKTYNNNNKNVYDQ